MKCLLDTHFLIWITLGSPEAEKYPWLASYRPWGVSPISLLEVQYLAEIGRLEVLQPDFTDALSGDRRFALDEAPLLPLVRRAFDMTWTRDPFDRLLAAHSSIRRLPFCTVDHVMREHHRYLPEELRISRRPRSE